MRSFARKDSNHQEIVKALQKIGAYVLDISQLKNCFDILVFYRGKITVMELKDGSKPPSKRVLTEGEENFRTQIELRGVKYNIVTSVSEALELVTNQTFIFK